MCQRGDKELRLRREGVKRVIHPSPSVWETLSHGLLVAWEEGDSSILFSLPPTMIFSPTSLSALRMTGENMRQPHQFLKFNEKGSGAETGAEAESRGRRKSCFDNAFSGADALYP